MEYVLPNGGKVIGTLAEVNAVLRGLGLKQIFVEDGVHYNSASRGIIKITDMDTTHIVNAIFKRYKAWLARLEHEKQDVTKFLARLQAGVAQSDPGVGDFTLLALVNELKNRNNRFTRMR